MDKPESMNEPGPLDQPGTLSRPDQFDKRVAIDNDWNGPVLLSLSDERRRGTGVRRSMPASGREQIEAQGLLLELSGVLFDSAAWRHWLFQLVCHLGLQSQYGTFFRVWDAEYQDSVTFGVRPYWQAMREFLLSAGLTRGQCDEVEAAGRARLDRLEHDARPLPGVISTLRQLSHRGFRLGLVVNLALDARELALRLARLESAGPFQATLGPKELGAFATATQRYRAAARAMELPLAELAFVGHDARQLFAASHAGLTTIAFNYDHDAVADSYLDQFDQLLSLVRLPAAKAQAALRSA